MLGFRRADPLTTRFVAIELRDGRRLRGRLRLPSRESGTSLLARAQPFLTIRTSRGDISFHRDLIAAVLLTDEPEAQRSETIRPGTSSAAKVETKSRVSDPGEDPDKEAVGFDPCRLLGVQPGASREELKAAWRKRIAECHPDRVAARGAGADIVAAAQRQAAQINAAYQALASMRRA